MALKTLMASLALAGVASIVPATAAQLTVGFSQIGSESGWRAAETTVSKSEASKRGVNLKIADAQQKQENQIKAIRSFIAQNVDAIFLAPVVSSGWDAVLKEASQAKIPVILLDRDIDPSGKDLYLTAVTSDSVHEGEVAGDWLAKAVGNKQCNVVELQGTVGAAPAIDRQKGFAEAIKANPNIKVVKSQSGNFTRAEGKTVMQSILQSTPDIDVLYAHNDDMGLGAIEAIEAAGKKPGKDIQIITVDAVKDGMTALSEGKINYIVECSPLLGPQLMDLAKKVKDKQDVPQRVLTEETTFTQEQAKAALPDRKY